MWRTDCVTEEAGRSIRNQLTLVQVRGNGQKWIKLKWIDMWNVLGSRRADRTCYRSDMKR